MRKRIKPTSVGPRHARLDNGTSWPLPDMGDIDNHSAGWTVRYAPLERVADVRFHAASVMDAYEALLSMPLDKSREVLRALKIAIAKREADHA
jgi:hypothetical protein